MFIWMYCLSPNDTKVIKVSSTALSAKRLLEGEDHTGHTAPVPYRSKDTITKPGREKIKQKQRDERYQIKFSNHLNLKVQNSLKFKCLKLCVWNMLPEHHEVLDHFFSQIVVYAVDLVLCEQGRQVGWQLLWALEVTAKRLLNNDPVPASVLQT